ncbi:sterol O-acyltransferase 1-like isoform X2 [Zophobas morio]|uniref:sterol O-acyltransferase 1-like isoform X2 n=1 Tax=Zophobas morio TaxID=2755281 RepID=UPI003082E471
MNSEKNKSKPSRFIKRNSLLTDLFENDHIKTVYHLFIATFIGLFVNTVAYDYLKKGEVVLGLKLIKSGFGKLHIALLVWCGYFLVTCSIYYIFKLWATYRNFHKLQVTKFWDWFWITLLSLYYIYSFKFAAYVVTEFKLPPASSAIVVLEQTRLLMKIHSFIRSNIHKPHSDNPLKLPPFSNFLYFLFVPTLIYQETYPRTAKINWKFVLLRLLECIAVIFYLSFVIDRFLNPTVQDFGSRKYTLNELILCIFENTTTGIFFLLPTFFLVLHSWQNLFGELTRFGDRLFYSDWWTCTDFSGYFRKWNIIVQSWLYLYVYKDFNDNVFKGNTTLSKLAVFLISAVVHEWVLTYMFGFFFPLLFAEFLVFGTIFNYVGAPKTAAFNVLFWYALALGMGSLVTMYGIEYYARANAPVERPSFREWVVPRFLTCDCIHVS